MSRRLIAIAAVLVLAALSAHAADPARSRAAALPLEPAAPLDLRTLFDLAPGVVATDGNGETVSAFAVKVLVARVGTDGELVKACVQTEEAARKFLNAPIQNVQTEGHDH